MEKTTIMSPKTESESKIDAIDGKNHFSVKNITPKQKNRHKLTKLLPQNVLPVVAYVIPYFALLIVCLFSIKENG